MSAFSFELYDIQVNTSDALFVSKGDESLEETVEEIVLDNLSNVNRTSSVHLAKPMSESVNYEETSYKHTKDTSSTSTNWEINGRVKASLDAILKRIGLNFELEVDGGYRSNKTTTSMVETFVKTGKFTTESVESFSKFDQDIELPPFSRTTFTVKTNPKKETSAFKFFYRITSPFTLDHTLNAIVRLGFDKNAYTIKNGELIVTKDGVLEVNSGIDTYIKIESTKLL